MANKYCVVTIGMAYTGSGGTALDAGTVPDPIAAVQVVLGADETAAGTIDTWVFGDPTA